MKNSVMLTITSSLTIVFLLLHLTDDFVHGISKIGPTLSLVVFPIITLLLFGALVLAERRSGYIIQIVGSILALGMPGLHFRGARINDIAQASGGFFFIFTLLLLGVTGLFSFVLAVRGLLSLRKAQTPA
jgi:hypothetical protein